MTTCAAAIKKFEEKTGETASDAKIVKLYCQIPPIAKLDSSLNNLAACERAAAHLQLSTNNIDKIGLAFTGLKNLKILSLGRNVIKKIEKLDDLGDSLEELWISYNQISALEGLHAMTKLTTLYMSNNNLKNFAELEKIAGLPNLKDVLFVGNPMYEGLTAAESRIEILRRLPNLAKIDGSMVLQRDRDEAAAAAAEE
ncbi:hypothetical protein AURANDRAFT_58761 [Aureococcus anophagefferens]|uniref:Dynein axonemal light chain 1 n=1 Tax=Aureococcus anophagefferens TaxID=44056 RepID=F0Y145_AURAN|nr:hypothetical protein AURANDRAFT_58761 [Aureococcus anophagefferens]EGB11004.1 hypothetical protein AURANDRAFT_58761 [Aureococcus anophagefferens]|eukprot:XP_009034564.1 hypothetical protein AURANDRAFT_58761 [Aureococcus anophagefferens]